LMSPFAQFYSQREIWMEIAKRAESIQDNSRQYPIYSTGLPIAEMKDKTGRHRDIVLPLIIEARHHVVQLEKLNR
jgi:hypothetical protein